MADLPPRLCTECGHPNTQHDCALEQDQAPFCFDCDCPRYIDPTLSFPIEWDTSWLCCVCKRLVEVGQPYRESLLAMGEAMIFMLTCVYCAPSEEDIDSAMQALPRLTGSGD